MTDEPPRVVPAQHGDAPGTYVLPRPFDDDGGHSVRAALPPALVERHGTLRWDDPAIVVLEDGRPLPLPTDQHAEIRRIGRGRYSAWGNTLYLSSSDGTSCQDNGREYAISLRRPNDAAIAGAAALARRVLHRPRLDVMARPSAGNVAGDDGATLYSLQPEPHEGGAPFGGPRDPGEIPGMIVPDEQALLAAYAGTVDLAAPDAAIVEIGSFLGRSTAALVLGVAHNPSLDLSTRRASAVTTLDQFRWPRSDVMEDMLDRFASEGGVAHLLRDTEEGIDFEPVFAHYLGAIDPRILARHRAYISDLPAIPGRIVLIHLDAPKNDEQFVRVLRAYGSQIPPGGVLAFQDFFFHGSGLLIGAVGWLLRAGLLLPEDAAGSTLVCRATTPLDDAVADALLSGLAAEGPGSLVESAYEAVSHVCADNEPHRFMARLLLARSQLAVEAGDHALAAKTLRTLRERHGVSPDVFEDLADLVAADFRSYGSATPGR